MKMRDYFGMLILLCFAGNASAYVSPQDTSLEDQFKTSFTAKSKPAYPQFAAVSFLKSDSTIEFKGTLDVKSQCGALGYVIPKSKCTGDMKPSKLCSDDPSMASVAGAGDYTTGCCDSKIYTVTENAECPNNAAKLSNDSCYWGGEKKYRCACDRGRYQYSSIKGEWCGTIPGTNYIDYTRFNANLACSAYEPRTKQNEMYFISCCPASYSKCDASNHEVGRGNECRVITNIITRSIEPRYEDCPCAQHYDTICTDGKLIDATNVCRKNGLVYTTETNCETRCTKTSETNIDDFLFTKIWHCLYEPEGATIKQAESELCRRPSYISTVGYPENEFYMNCEAQGYTKSEADCYNKEAMIRCPTNGAKVWCLESKYCTGYDVGGDDACDDTKAKIDMCPSANAGNKRCKYKAESCNKGWSEGSIIASTLALTADQTTLNNIGMWDTCCQEGYKYQNGKCVANVCSRIKYPYSNNPGTEPGIRKECSEADPSKPTGYSKHYGYEDCYTEDNTEFGQGMWKRKSNNSSEADYYKCVCERNSPTKTGLPFDVSHYYELNSASPYGFNKGVYGHSVSCTDDEGSYYGYSDCYIRYYMGSGENKYKCLPAPTVNYCYVYPYLSIGQINTFLQQNNIAPYSISSKKDPRKQEDAYCVNRYTHYEDRYGNKLGDESVKALLVEGCNTGTESACNICYHVSNLVKENGLWHAHGRFLIKVNTDVNQGNLDEQYGFEKCPEGFFKGCNAYGSCSKYCYAPNYNTCATNDILKKGDIVVGLVTAKYTNEIHVLSLTGATKTFDEAVRWSKEDFAPPGLELDPVLGKGNWHMYGSGDNDNSCDFAARGSVCAAGYSYPGSTWVNQVTYEDGQRFAREFGRCGYNTWRQPDKPFPSYPMIRISF